MRINGIYTLSASELGALAAYWEARGYNVHQEGDALIIGEPCECCGEARCSCFGGV